MSFYSLVKSVRHGNAGPCSVSALLDTQVSSLPSNNLWDQVDALIASGILPGAKVASIADHDQHIERNDSLFTICQDMLHESAQWKQTARLAWMVWPCPGLAELTLHKDRGGLLYPGGILFFCHQNTGRYVHRMLQQEVTACQYYLGCAQPSDGKMHTQNWLQRACSWDH